MVMNDERSIQLATIKNKRMTKFTNNWTHKQTALSGGTHLMAEFENALFFSKDSEFAKNVKFFI